MPTPQLPGFGDFGAFVRWTKHIEYRINLLFEKLNNVLANTGLSVPSPGVTQVDGNLHVATGNLLVDGSTTINGPLVLPNGSVNNAALVSPVTGGSSWASATGFSLSTTLTELAGIDITVPAGFTQAFGTIGAYVFSYNPNTTGGSNGVGGDAIYAQARISTTQSRANPIGVSGSGGFATSSSGTGYGLTGLTPGSTIRLSVYGSSAYAAMASNVNNYANAFASVIWLR